MRAAYDRPQVLDPRPARSKTVVVEELPDRGFHQRLHGNLRRERSELQPLLGLTIEMDVDEVLDTFHPLALQSPQRLARVRARLLTISSAFSTCSDGMTTASSCATSSTGCRSTGSRCRSRRSRLPRRGDEFIQRQFLLPLHSTTSSAVASKASISSTSAIVSRPGFRDCRRHLLHLERAEPAVDVLVDVALNGPRSGTDRSPPGRR